MHSISSRRVQDERYFLVFLRREVRSDEPSELCEYQETGIFPIIEVEHLASHILPRMAQLLSEDWERMYGHPVHYLETFVDPGRFRGTCYRAANWKVLGRTTGRGKDAPTKKPNRSIKEVLGYPLSKKGLHSYYQPVKIRG